MTNETRLIQFLDNISYTGKELATQLDAIHKQTKKIKGFSEKYKDLELLYKKNIASIFNISIHHKMLIINITEAIKKHHNNIIIMNLTMIDISRCNTILINLQNYASEFETIIRNKLNKNRNKIKALQFASSKNYKTYNSILYHQKELKQNCKALQSILENDNDVVDSIKKNPRIYFALLINNVKIQNLLWSLLQVLTLFINLCSILP
jgi:hypothetical protein